MNYYFKKSLLVLVPLFLSLYAFAYTKRDFLQKKADINVLKTVLLKPAQWVPYPAYDDRAGWDKFLGTYKKEYIERGISMLNYEWKIVKATDYLDYNRTGARATMENPLNDNISAITTLFMAELAEGKGRFIDQLTNGVFAACEMTSWAASAHLPLQLARTPFPSHNEQIIDLVSGDIGSLFSWIYYFLHNDFDKINPLIASRLRFEIQRKILDTYMSVDHLWWMAFNYKPGDIVNNWNPWCNSNVLQSFALIESDPDKLAKAVYRTMISVDHFINYNNEDGACEEGPSYWGHAAGKLYDYLKVLYDITGGKISVFDEPIIKNMGEYISRAYVGNDWVVNFADASAKLRPDASLIYQYGKAVNSVEMMQFSAFLKTKDTAEHAPQAGRDVFRAFQTLLFDKEGAEAKALHHTPDYTWYPQTQVVFVKEGSLFLAAKGGHNNESHNHNDIGSFNLYLDETPFLIDAGVGTYTRQTFGPERYSIWTMQSSYHNLPEINGYPQKFGAEFKAQAASYNPKNKIFSLDIAKAYPQEAHVQKWIRTYQVQKGQLIITDDFSVSNPQKSNRIHFLTRGAISKNEGRILIDISGKKMELKFDQKQFDAFLDTVALNDRRLSSVWGKELYRIALIAKQPIAKGKYNYTITKK